MKPKDRQKICSNCDGRIAIDSEHCPYCGTLATAMPREETSEPAPLFDHQSIQDSLTSLYTPPYSNKSTPSMKQDKMRPKPITKENHDNQLSASLGKYNYSQSSLPVIDTEEKSEEKSSFSPLLFLLLGSNMLVIGLLQLFFSEGGILRLEWKSKYWFVYCLIAIPVLLMGYKKASQMSEKPQE